MTIARVYNTQYNLQTYQGDSGTLTIKGLPNDTDDYVFFMEIHGAETIVKEIHLNGASEVTIDFTVEDTTKLGVGSWEYGIKLCQGSTENTLIPSLRMKGVKSLFIVNKKVVEGYNV